MATRSKWYVGVKAGKPYEMFQSKSEPTSDSHGNKYTAVIGSFSTREGAWVMAEFGKGNPHLRHVSDAERMARSMKKKGETPWTKKNPGASWHKKKMKWASAKKQKFAETTYARGFWSGEAQAHSDSASAARKIKKKK